jgi:hypothetical protein
MCDTGASNALVICCIRVVRWRARRMSRMDRVISACEPEVVWFGLTGYMEVDGVSLIGLDLDAIATLAIEFM